MSFAVYQAQFQRLYEEHAAWRLLRARRAPTVLALLATIFAEKNEISYGQARLFLDNEIARNREMGFWEEAQTPASTYLNEWIKEGWLRELDDQLMPTDAAARALRWAQQLDERTASTTASRLRLVQEAVRDFVVSLQGNTVERVAILQQKQATIAAEIAQIEAGNAPEYSERQQREMLRQIYDLAAGLTYDFRYLEDEIRQLDRISRKRMIERDLTRGQVLQQVFEKEEFLAKTEAGGAFNGFYELLCDVHRTHEFREQLLLILQDDTVQYLSPSQHRFLSHLMGELNEESNRVFAVRRRTEAELRAYVDSGLASENQAIGSKIRELERWALLLREQDFDMDTPLNLSLNVGKIKLSSPKSIKLKQASEGFQAADWVEHENRHVASLDVLAQLNTVQIQKVAVDLQQIVRTDNKAHTLASLVQARPITRGMEELVAYYRVVRAVLNRLPEKIQADDSFEELMIDDTVQQTLMVRVPRLTVLPEMFPDNVDDLAI